MTLHIEPDSWMTIPTEEFERLHAQLRELQREQIVDRTPLTNRQVSELVDRLQDVGDKIRDNRGDRDGWWGSVRDIAAELRRVDLQDG